MDDEDDGYVPGIPWGDLSAIFVAGCFSLFCIGLIVYMLLGGHPLAGIVGAGNNGSASSEQPPPPTQADVPMHLGPGEVRVFVPPKAKKPSPKP
jgi:hypothetical protein